MFRRTALWMVVVTLLPLGAASALKIGEALVKTVATGVVVNAVAGPADTALNQLTARGGLPVGTATKVVPVLSVGEKGYVGLVQVAGSASLVRKVKATVQAEASFDDKQYRIKLLMPMDSQNPVGANRVRGIGVTALVDMALSDNSYRLPPSVPWNAGDVVKAGAIGYAASQYGSQVDSFINSAFRNEGGTPQGVTKVVPYLSFGSKAYIGMMQVAGPASAVKRVKAVWQLEQLFDGGRVRLRALVPTDSTSPMRLRRVKGVGCTAVIDAMVLRAKEARLHPDHYGYFGSAPIFLGASEDPHYRRPPGWERGEKVGWMKHGTPALPPGLAKKQRPPVLIIPVPREREPETERDRGRGRGHGKR